MYGSVFADESEAAFSNYRMWESFGFIIAFAYSFFLCTSVKLYILTSVLIVGWTGFAIVEYIIKTSKVAAKQHVDKEKGRPEKYDNPGYVDDTKF